jgi:hypothetical protein
MCDYSLSVLRTRLAVEGEELVVYRFPTGSLGMTSPSELVMHEPDYLHAGWHPYFNPRESACAVCIPPGARLLLRDIPERLRRQLGLREAETIEFIQMSAAEWRHRDGVRFSNGQEILLQRLTEGQRAIVLSLVSEQYPLPLEEAETDAVAVG